MTELSWGKRLENEHWTKCDIRGLWYYFSGGALEGNTAAFFRNSSDILASLARRS